MYINWSSHHGSLGYPHLTPPPPRSIFWFNNCNLASSCVSRMTTGCRGCLRRWCWWWSATLSFLSSTPWLRATPSGCSSRGTQRRKPSDEETQKLDRRPMDCFCCCWALSSAPVTKNKPHSSSSSAAERAKIQATFCLCVCVQGMSVSRFCSSSCHLSL